MNLGEICNRDVVIAHKQESLAQAVRLMRQHHVGDIVIVEDNGQGRKPVGILTDRDILISAISAGINPQDILIEDVMSLDPVTAKNKDSLTIALKTMRSSNIRRLPIVDEHDELVSILTLDDILDILAEALNDLAVLANRQTEREIRKTDDRSRGGKRQTVKTNAPGFP